MSVASENTLSGAENIELFGIVDDRRACLLFDTQNPVLFGLDPVLLASQVAHLVGAYVHVKDGVSGEGDANIGSGAATCSRRFVCLSTGASTASLSWRTTIRKLLPSGWTPMWLCSTTGSGPAIRDQSGYAETLDGQDRHELGNTARIWCVRR